MDLGLRDRSALVTGASRGIGLAIAHALAAEGAQLAICSRTQADLERAASELEGAHDVPVVAVASDLSSADGIAFLQRAVEQWLGPLDILVNNAGAVPGGSVESLEEDTWRAAWELKLWGYVRTIRAFLPGMRQRRRGVIINVIGIAGNQPAPDFVAGGMANAALVNLTRGLARSVGPDGVRVVGISPGPIRTSRAVELAARAAAARDLSVEEVLRERAASVPLGRLGEPDEIGSIAAFLASDRAGYIHGVTIPVDGGLTYGT